MIPKSLTAAILPQRSRTTDENCLGGPALCRQLCPKSAADAIVVAWFYDVFLLLVATGFLQVDGLRYFGSGSFSKWLLSFGCVIAPLLAGNRQFSAFTLA